MTHSTHRRGFMAGAGALALATPSLAQGAAGRVVVIGGGFAGATVARAIKAMDARVAVTLVEPNATFTACPFSNEVIVGLRGIEAQQFGYDGVRKAGVEVIVDTASAVDAEACVVTLAGGARLAYDRLVIAPGVDIAWGALPGYTPEAAEIMPHAWKAGAQTLLLRAQLEAMEDGGVVVISAPANPYRCPPGPYERASLIAWYLKTRKPKSKLLLLDAKDAFSKQKLFQNAWKELYPNLEWVSLSSGGKVVSVDAAGLVLETEFGKHKASVANVIPPQRAGAVAAAAGVTDRSGWCPMDPVTFESTLRKNIHVIGDAAIAGAMPKSAFAANAQAKACAAAIVALLNGRAPAEPLLLNTCYSVAAPEYGFSVAGVYRPAKGLLNEVAGSGGASPVDAPEATRALEARLANGWYNTITAEVFG